MTSKSNQSTVNQSKGLLDIYYFIGDMGFPRKMSSYLLNCIEKSLSNLYKPDKQNGIIKEKNMKFRNNEKNNLTILARIEYFLGELEEHSSKFHNKKINLLCSVGVFEKIFPNIENLFYERYILRKTVPGIEEGEMDGDPAITVEEVSLHDYAQRLSKLGLSNYDYSKFFYSIYGGDNDEYDSDCEYDDNYDCDEYDADCEYEYDFE